MMRDFGYYYVALAKHESGRRMIKRLLFLMALGCSAAHAANFPISSGASRATIQSTINRAAAAGGGNTVTFAAGSYSITSQINIPCPASALTIQGPTPAGLGTTWPITPTAILTGSLTNNAAFHGNACNTAVTIQYLQFNGGNPSGGGGGFLYMPQGMNNLTVQYNWFYGNSAIQQATQIADSFIWMDGSNITGSTRTENTKILWNRFGFMGSNDCANLMNVLGGNSACDSTGYNLGGTHACLYQGGVGEKDEGGYCAAVGDHVNTDDLNISNNTVSHQEQGFKFFEGCTSPGCTDVYTPTNVTVANNDFAGIHRIAIEAQQGSPGPWNFTNNSYHDMILPDGVTWGWSLPQGGPQHVTGSLLIGNVAGGTDKYGVSASRSYAIEYWGNGNTASNNLIQGLWGGGISWGYGGGGWSINNNTLEQLTTYFENYISSGEGCNCAPSQSGNVTTHTVSTITSVAPTISPTPTGTYSAPITVTLSDPGYTSGAVPQGNTSIWYTTDGSRPIPGGAGTTKFYTGPFSVAQGSTVQAIGMWGALNQPASYPSGFGFTPSAVVGAHYVSFSGTRH
jgi:hypothetical protein